MVLCWVNVILCSIYTGFIAYLGFDETISQDNKLGKRNNKLEFWIMFGKMYLVIWNIFFKPEKWLFVIYFISYGGISIHEILLGIQHVFYDYEMYVYFLTFFFFEKLVFVLFSIMNLIEYRFLNYNLAYVVLIFVLIFSVRLANNLAVIVSMSFTELEIRKGEN